MGASDAKEMLEVAKAECLRLERENTQLRKKPWKLIPTDGYMVPEDFCSPDEVIRLMAERDARIEQLERVAQVVPQPNREALRDALTTVRGIVKRNYHDAQDIISRIDIALSEPAPALSPAPLSIDPKALAEVIIAAAWDDGPHPTSQEALRWAVAVIAHLSAQPVEGEVELVETLRRVHAWADRPERVTTRTVTYDGEDGPTTEKFTVYHPDYIAALQRLVEVQP